MGIFKKEYKGNFKELLNKFIYPKQFKKEKELIFNIYNFICAVNTTVPDNIESIIRLYIPGFHASNTDYIKIKERFDFNKATIFKPEYFSRLKDFITPEDLIYIHSHKRHITLKEIIYIAYRITQKIITYKSGETIIYNNYFKTPGFKKEYEKFTGKKYTNEKYANILKVLQKHKYLFVAKNSQNNNIYMIGTNNPYYQLSQVKNITEEIPEVRTSLEEKNKKLEHENTELKNMLKANKTDYLKAKDSNIKIEQYKIQQSQVVELLEEKEQEIIELEKKQVKKRKWCICNKPVVVKRQDTFEQDLYNLISGKK